MYVNSLDKIVFSYLGAVASRSFVYECNGKAKMVRAKPLSVSPTIFRGYTCPPACGACCQRFSLVYLPSEPHPYPLKRFTARFDGRPVELFHDPQDDHQNRYCRNLKLDDGRCVIHGKHPFTCDFELIRVHMSHDKVRMGLQLYGRAWAMMRIDGERGAQCEILPASPHHLRETSRKLKRLYQWASHMGVETHLPRIIQWVDTGPHKEPLRL